MFDRERVEVEVNKAKAMGITIPNLEEERNFANIINYQPSKEKGKEESKEVAAAVLAINKQENVLVIAPKKANGHIGKFVKGVAGAGTVTKEAVRNIREQVREMRPNMIFGFANRINKKV